MKISSYYIEQYKSKSYEWIICECFTEYFWRQVTTPLENKTTGMGGLLYKQSGKYTEDVYILTLKLVTIIKSLVSESDWRLELGIQVDLL